MLLGLFACTPSTSKHATNSLTQAEEWIWSIPDSALRILEDLPHPERLTGKEQADYALLLSHARTVNISQLLHQRHYSKKNIAYI